MSEEVCEDRNEERRGFACSCLSTSSDVRTREGTGKDLGLDGGAVLEALVEDGVEEFLRQVQVMERGFFPRVREGRTDRDPM